MKLFFIFPFLFFTTMSFAQISLPLDFESNINSNDFVDFDGGTATVIANPQPGGINSSATVAQIVRNGGEIWAGSKITFFNTFNFSNLGGLSMKVYTDAPAGTQVKLKLEGGAGEFVADAVTKTSGAWEVLTWDFSTAPLDKTDLVLMFDYGFLGDGSSASTFLFDDIQQVPALPPVDLDIDFEQSSTITSDFTDFNGGVATVIPNPDQSGINTSNTVGRIIRNGGLTWSGSKLILAQNLDFSIKNFISIDVYTAAPIGTPVQLKLEGSSTPEIILIPTTSTGKWETLLFDFAAAPATLNTIAFMFDIGTVGDGSTTSTFFFDNIKQTDGTITGLQFDQSASIATFPNPATTQWNLSSEKESIQSVSIINAMGAEVANFQANSNNISIDVSPLAAGIYTAVIQLGNDKKLIKRLVK